MPNMAQNIRSLSIVRTHDIPDEEPPPYDRIYQHLPMEVFRNSGDTREHPIMPTSPRNNQRRSNLPVTIQNQQVFHLADELPPSYADVIGSSESLPQVIDISTTVIFPEILSANQCYDEPAVGICPFCMNPVTTEVTYRPGKLSCWMYVVVCLLLGPILALLVCCVSQLQNVWHRCPKCKKTIHIYKRKIADSKQ